MLNGTDILIQVINIIVLIFLVLIFAIGLLNAIFPKKIWKIFASWKATKEPSDAYFLVQRIAGIIVMIIVIALVLFPYLMSKQ